MNESSSSPSVSPALANEREKVLALFTFLYITQGNAKSGLMFAERAVRNKGLLVGVGNREQVRWGQFGLLVFYFLIIKKITDAIIFNPLILISLHALLQKIV